MPEISRFYGIVIQMYFANHPPPHSHAFYAGEAAKFGIADLRLLDGELPARALALVREWAAEHQVELMEAWRQAATNQLPTKITPLS